MFEQYIIFLDITISRVYDNSLENLTDTELSTELAKWLDKYHTGCFTVTFSFDSTGSVKKLVHLATEMKLNKRNL